MDRNSVIGIVLIVAIFIGWSYFTRPSEEERQQMIARQDSINKAQEVQRVYKIKQDSIAAASRPAETTTTDSSVAKTIAPEQFYTLENEFIKATFTTHGGRPYSVQLKNYRTYDSLPLMLFDGDSTDFNFNFTRRPSFKTEQTRFLQFAATDSNTKNIVVSESAKALVLRSVLEEGKYIEFTYKLDPKSYMVNMEIAMNGLEREIDRNLLVLEWGFYSPTQEKGWKNEVMNTTVYYKYNDEDVDFFNARSNKEYVSDDIKTKLDWINYKDQFFSSFIIGEKPFEGAKLEVYKQPENGKYTKRFFSEIEIEYTEGKNIGLDFYFGPNEFKYLKKNYGDKDMHAVVAVGRSIIKWINQGVIINLFNWLNKYISNYGIIILLMTIIIKLFLLPLTFKSYMSQAKMRVVKPMVDEATKNIPKDKAMDRQKVTMEIYKKVGVSPLGGCLPMILQMPILFAMFRFFPGSIELRQESFLWATDLSTYDDLISWGTSIPLLGNHLSLFTLLMTITTIISMKTNSSASMGDNGMPGMKVMMYIMPVTFLFVLNDFSSALTYYYFLANVITFGQNFIFKRLIDEEEVLKKLQAKKAKPKKKSKWQQRIEEMQKMQQQGGKKRK